MKSGVVTTKFVSAQPIATVATQMAKPITPDDLKQNAVFICVLFFDSSAQV